MDSSNRFINRDSAIARACSVGIPASTIAQIFGLQTPEKPEQTGAINLSASPSAYGQVPYYTPFYHPAYGMYGASAAQFNDSEPNGQAYNVSNHVHPSMNYQYPQTGAAQYTQSTVGQYPQGTGQYPGYVQVSCGYPSISSEGAQPQVNLPQGERTEE